ncbi:MAG: ABC transporter substrate-binding protein, partial [Bacteroidetes bacterium B1(2017)]
MKNTIRIGCGAGFSGDRLEPAVILAEKGNLDYLVLECLAERTIALAQKRKQLNPELGYDPFLERRMRMLLLAIWKNKICLITNMGAANPLAAAQKVKDISLELGLNIKVAAVFGDDVLSMLDFEALAMETNLPVKQSGEIISANAYLGVDGILKAL